MSVDQQPQSDGFAATCCHSGETLMYTHEKNNTLRHYLKRKAASKNARQDKSSAPNLDYVPDVIKIFDVEKMDDILRTHDRKSNLHRNHQRYIDFLEDTFGYLELATVPSTIFDKLDELLLKFPNFEEVIDYYREQMALAQMTDRAVFAANPLLITGRPRHRKNSILSCAGQNCPHSFLADQFIRHDRWLCLGRHVV
jgi:hypothetical protein